MENLLNGLTDTLLNKIYIKMRILILIYLYININNKSMMLTTLIIISLMKLMEGEMYIYTYYLQNIKIFWLY